MTPNLPIRHDLPEEFRASLSQIKRARLVRDASKPVDGSHAIAEKFALRGGEMYRISYSVGSTQQRRVSRSVAVFDGESERRGWAGDVVRCLDFSLPHGRTLSLLADQLVDVRPAELNDRGQWVLANDGAGGRRRRGGRRAVLRTHPI